MTTPITSAPDAELDANAAREKLPPGEQMLTAGVAAPSPESHEAKLDPNHQPGHVAKSLAHWVHQHPEAHKKGAGFVTYQFLRSVVACVPYGLSMAATLAGFTKMQSVGEGMAAKEGAAAFTQRFGRGLAGFAKFGPAKMGALVATSFTLYRGTSKLVKWLTEYLFNPKDSEDRTAEKVGDLVPEAWRKIKEITPAEVSSTPIAAVVLGFIVSAFAKPYNYVKETIVNGKIVKDERILVDAKNPHSMNIDWTNKNLKSVSGLGNKLKVMGSALAHSNAKFIPQAAINSFGYALFFELGDRLYKDTQIRRGVWSGEHNSIKALKAAPDEYAQGIKDGNDAPDKPKYADSALAPVKEKHHYSFFDSEPSLGRFVFRRLLPTAVGITAYTAVKMRWACMLGNNFTYDKGLSFGQFGKKALGEGVATTLFFLIPLVSEPWEKLYDNFFARKEKIAQDRDHHQELLAKPLTPHQENNYATLLERVNTKEKAASNDGQYQQRA